MQPADEYLLPAVEDTMEGRFRRLGIFKLPFQPKKKMQESF